ncbi:hypothetical protein WR25_19382 [Diploscapter pachys]|uniref:Uncharacterized protein n=1 Tax=Diploscapter pachys TaxID=2018661 RepID=A0A2A2KEX8_9BILA|nr:hypothetical protein WR25_19382 [Diploscapter pachys]
MVGLKLLLIFSIALVCRSIKDSATTKFTSEEKEFIEKNWEYIKEDLNTKDKEIVIDDGEIKMTACILGKAVTDPGCIDILLEGLKKGDLTVDDISEEKYLKTFIETLKSDNPEVVEAALIPIYEIVSDGTDYHVQASNV